MASHGRTDLPLHRRGPSGGGIPQGPHAAGRRCRAHPFAGRRAGPQHRRAGRDEPRLEARAGGKRTSPDELLDTIMPSGIQSARASCARQWRRSRCARGRTNARPARHHGRIAAINEPRDHIAADLAGSAPLRSGRGHALLGRRMPDFELVPPAGQRGSTLLHDARPALLNLGAQGIDISGWADRVKAGRRRVWRRVGAARARRRSGPGGGAGPARRLYRLDRRPGRPGAQRRPDDLGWSAIDPR